MSPGEMLMQGTGERACRKSSKNCGAVLRVFHSTSPRERATIALMRLYRFAWLLWIVGTVLIVLSWFSAVTNQVGWAGFAIAMVGVLLSWLGYRGDQGFHQLPPEQQPVPPSGVEVDHDTPLEEGARVLAYSQGYWWRARIVAIEDGEMVRVDFPGWDPGLQYRVPRTQLQLDLTRTAPTDTRIREGRPPNETA